MKTRRTKQIHAYKLDLTRTNRKGDFLCPQCGATISPDDFSENNYAILDVLVDHYGLSELVICCKKCANQINLTGFYTVQKNLS